MEAKLPQNCAVRPLQPLSDRRMRPLRLDIFRRSWADTALTCHCGGSDACIPGWPSEEDEKVRLALTFVCACEVRC
jgi:hypothetical protein